MPALLRFILSMLAWGGGERAVSSLLGKLSTRVPKYAGTIEKGRGLASMLGGGAASYATDLMLEPNESPNAEASRKLYEMPMMPPAPTQNEQALTELALMEDMGIGKEFI